MSGCVAVFRRLASCHPGANVLVGWGRNPHSADFFFYLFFFFLLVALPRALRLDLTAGSGYGGSVARGHPISRFMMKQG